MPPPRLGLRFASLDALLQDTAGCRAFLRSAPAAAARGGRLTGHATAKPWNPAVSRLPPRPASGRLRRPHGRHGGLLAGRIRCTPHTLCSLARLNPARPEFEVKFDAVGQVVDVKQRVVLCG